MRIRRRFQKWPDICTTRSATRKGSPSSVIDSRSIRSASATPRARTRSNRGPRIPRACQHRPNASRPSSQATPRRPLAPLARPSRRTGTDGRRAETAVADARPALAEGESLRPAARHLWRARDTTAPWFAPENTMMSSGLQVAPNTDTPGGERLDVSARYVSPFERLVREEANRPAVR